MPPLNKDLEMDQHFLEWVHEFCAINTQLYHKHMLKFEIAPFHLDV